MASYHTPRFKVGTLVGYAEILELRDASSCHQVRYIIRTTCCERTQAKSHKAIRMAQQRQWDICPLCQRIGKPRKAAPLKVAIPAYVQPKPIVCVVPPQILELTPTKPVDLPDWLCLAYSRWPKPPSVRTRIWGQQ